MAKQSTYTDPELRERLKADIVAGDRGGRPGQWSARKAQLLAAEYKKAGGGYTSEKSDESESAQHLDEWTSEQWQTADGDAKARDGAETRRYLPKKAWEDLTPEQRRTTDERKRAASKKGQQFVSNTDAAKEAGRHAREHGDQPFEGYADSNAKDLLKRLKDLDQDTLRKVRDYERDHGGRKTVLQRVEGLLS